jgi:hypothetical protein
MVERDFPRIIDDAVPLDGMGIVNVNCVRYVSLSSEYINSYADNHRYCKSFTMIMVFSVQNRTGQNITKPLNRIGRPRHFANWKSTWTEELTMLDQI